MNAQELFTASGKSAGVYFCSQCRRVLKDKQFADDCCKCRFCGGVIEDRKREFSGCHSACWHADRRQRQLTLLDEAELVEHYDGPVFSIDGWGRDGYIFDDAEEVLSDSVENPEDWPEFLLCCRPSPFPAVRIDNIVEQCADGMYEEAYDDFVVPESLVKAIEEFNAANKHLVSYDPDYSRKVKAPPMPAELAEEKPCEPSK